MFHRLPKLELQVYPASLLFNTQHIYSQGKQHYWKKKKRVLRPQFSRVSLHVLGVPNYSAFSCEDLWGSELVNRCKITTDTKILGTFYRESPKVHELLIEQLTDKTINPKSLILVVGFTQNLLPHPCQPGALPSLNCQNFSWLAQMSLTWSFSLQWENFILQTSNENELTHQLDGGLKNPPLHFLGKCGQAWGEWEGRVRGGTPFLLRVSCVFAPARLKEKKQKQI